MAFKITNLAKDLGIKSKEITELLAARGVECIFRQLLVFIDQERFFIFRTFEDNLSRDT